MKDPYQILGVTKSSTPEEIKKAYRKLAVEFHPDKNKSKESEEKFKEINQAYEVLGNPQKKAQYDQFGDAAFNGGAGGGAGGGPFGGGQGPFTYSYSTNGSQGGFDFGGGQGGFSDPFDIFEQFFGGGASPFGRRKPAYSLQIDFMDAIKGVTNKITVDGKSRDVRIPAGINEGSTIRFEDFDIIIQVKPHPYFKREGNDIVTQATISMARAALGGIEKIQTLDGKVNLKIPEATQPGALIRMKGKGVKNLKGGGFGDHYVRIDVEIPKKLNSKQKELLKEFEAQSGKHGWF